MTHSLYDPSSTFRPYRKIVTQTRDHTSRFMKIHFYKGRCASSFQNVKCKLWVLYNLQPLCYALSKQIMNLKTKNGFLILGFINIVHFTLCTNYRQEIIACCTSCHFIFNVKQSKKQVTFNLQTLEEKISFATCFMHIKLSYAAKT